MSNPRSYDLLSERWMPVLWLNNASGFQKPKVGIREALQKAHEVQCICHTSPFIEFGLYRLLITIVLDAFIVAGQRPTIGKMRKMLDDGHFDHSVVDRYLDAYRGGFDLWDKDSPFLQRREKGLAGKKPTLKDFVTMFSAIPSGANVTHWYHYNEGETALGDDVIAQLLAAVSPFNFKVKPGEVRTLAGDPPMYTLVLGKSLFETIVLNLPRPNGRNTIQQEKDNGPAWRTRLDLSRLPKTPTFTQGFTWPVRVIELENKGNPVTRAINKAAYKKPKEKAQMKEEEESGFFYDIRYGWRDPNAGTETGEGAINHIKAKPNAPIWRDAVPLILLASEGEAIYLNKRRSRPEVVSNALRVLAVPCFRFAVYGMRKKSGGGGDVKVEEWFRSVFTFPAEVARDNRLSTRAIDAFRDVQKVADALQSGIRMLRPLGGAKKRSWKEVLQYEANLMSAFWQEIEPLLVHNYLEALARNDEGAEGELWNGIRRQILKAFSGAANPQRHTADGLFRIANAKNWLERRLAKLLP